MKIENIVHVLGRGYIFIGEPEKEVHLGDKIRIEDAEFEVRGVEGATCTKMVGLVLSPNKSAYITIQKGDEVEIISN